MADCDISRLVGSIHDADGRACLVVTGGGISAVGALFAMPGASRTVIDAQIPYARAALDAYLGAAVVHHVSAAEAGAMAIAAHARAVQLDAGRETQAAKTVGLSCTAAIATDRERRGENRCHVGWYDGTGGKVYSLTMLKGERDRPGEEAICAAMVLNALAEAIGLDERLQLALLDSERVVVATV